MLRKLFPVALAALMSFIMISCEEDPASPDNPTMKAEIDGEDWETTSVTATSGSTIIISAAKTDGTAIGLVLSGVTETGEYEIDGIQYRGTYNPSATTILTAGSGEGKITVTSIDDDGIVGTFEFTATDGTTTVEVTDGSFAAKYNI